MSIHTHIYLHLNKGWREIKFTWFGGKECFISLFVRMQSWTWDHLCPCAFYGQYLLSCVEQLWNSDSNSCWNWKWIFFFSFHMGRKKKPAQEKCLEGPRFSTASYSRSSEFSINVHIILTITKARNATWKCNQYCVFYPRNSRILATGTLMSPPPSQEASQSLTLTASSQLGSSSPPGGQLTGP